MISINLAMAGLDDEDFFLLFATGILVMVEMVLDENH